MVGARWGDLASWLAEKSSGADGWVPPVTQRPHFGWQGANFLGTIGSRMGCSALLQTPSNLEEASLTRRLRPGWGEVG